jgi:N-acetylmuramoyl-L-alanine amidase
MVKKTEAEKPPVVGDFHEENHIGFRPWRNRQWRNREVLRETRMPAVLLGNLFIDHSKDAGLLADKSWLSQK